MSRSFPYERVFDCVHCGLCLEACPTYTLLGTEADSPRGRVHLMRAVADGRVALAEAAPHLDSCLGCRACETACPSGVAYGELIESMRAPVEDGVPRRGYERLLRSLLVRRILPYPHRLRALTEPFGWAAAGQALRRLRRLPGPLGRLAGLLPAVTSGERVPAESRAEGVEAGCVGVLRGCALDVLYPEVLVATVRVLTRLGYRVIAPASGCCGALQQHAGFEADARVSARRTMEAFAGVDTVVVAAAGCSASMRAYEHLLPEAGERSAAFGQRVVDAGVFVERRVADLGQRVRWRPLPRVVTYHDACHLLHGQGIGAEPRRLLGRIPELRCVPLVDADRCCGSAGTYNLTQPALADRLQQEKTRAIADTGAQTVVTGNPGCMAQIASGLRARHIPIDVRHTLQIVDQALASVAP